MPPEPVGHSYESPLSNFWFRFARSHLRCKKKIQGCQKPGPQRSPAGGGPPSEQICVPSRTDLNSIFFVQKYFLPNFLQQFLSTLGTVLGTQIRLKRAVRTKTSPWWRAFSSRPLYRSDLDNVYFVVGRCEEQCRARQRRRYTNGADELDDDWFGIFFEDDHANEAGDSAKEADEVNFTDGQK